MANIMKIINFGSLNIDKVCSVEEFVQPGETIMATGYSVNAGGKGLNQSVAAARAGAKSLQMLVRMFPVCGSWIQKAAVLLLK